MAYRHGGGNPIGEPKRALTLDDFWRLRTVDDVQLSPDGRTAAFVVGCEDERTNTAHSAIWLADVEGGTARPLTSGDARDWSPRWSPDGARLAFVSTRHEGRSQIFVLEAGGGEAWRLTGAPSGAHSPAWSPDGRQICYASEVESDRQRVEAEDLWFERHPDAAHSTARLRRQTTLLSRLDGRGYLDRRTHLFVVKVDDPSTEPRQITHGDADHLKPAWSPDGALIACVANREGHAEGGLGADIWTVAVDDGTLRRLTDARLQLFAPTWAPDGSTVAFYGRPDFSQSQCYHDYRLWIVSREGGDQRCLSHSTDRPYPVILSDYMWPEFQPPMWSPDGQSILFLVGNHGKGEIRRVSLHTGDIAVIPSPPAAIAGAQLTPDGRTVVGLAATATHPYDVYALPAGGGALRWLTPVHDDLLRTVRPVEPEHITFQGPGGWQIEGWLVRPLSAGDSPPMILHIHGGPQGAFGHTFYFHYQALASAGYASLYINPRGSTGYGEEFARAADWGEDDFRDLMAGVDAALARGRIDPQRLGVTGLSYGGFMTNWIVGHTDRFAAAASINGIANMTSFYGVSDIGPLWLPIQLGEDPWSSEEGWRHYRHHSPLTYVDRITTPLLLIQSENDWRCPIEQGEQMLNALRVRNRTVELIRVPGASHAVFLHGTPHQQFLIASLIYTWFDTYLRQEETGMEPHEVEGVTVGEPVPAPGGAE